ncbi:AAA family ATPase [Caballeronia sp. LZ033]|uniref:AAA family ATPase n=1 Tax=Caballeronia sp. LZ033 TaxID=3038566 RepID=UPI00285D079D|nr:AAA family ATPase [Caballeronia sp. LZ033]MDR5813081.1 AAA family ATPase [Caballeronia sp. LZ033]
MLRLRSFKFEQINQGESWSYSWNKIGDLAMIVGVNATGKTRLLNTLKGFAKTLSGLLMVVGTEITEAEFSDEGSGSAEVYRYKISRENGVVKEERLVINGEDRIIREAGGETRIFSPKLYQNGIDPWDVIGIADNQGVVAAKRDTIQYPFLEPLIEWAENVEHFSFTTEGSGFHVMMQLGTAFDFAAAKRADQSPIPLSGYFMEAARRHDTEFGSFIVNAMNVIDFHISKIELASAPIPAGAGVPMIGVAAYEKGRLHPTFQNEMSSGMLRALAAIIKLRTAQTGKVGTLLLDDIGEGMDHSRSVKLINLLLREAEKSEIQLFMTTNDRFVMNEVPLQHWVILNRSNGVISVRDRYTDQKLFDKYERLGLSNFDLFKATTKTKNG